MGFRSGIRKNLFRIPDPGVKKAPDPGSRSATLHLTQSPNQGSSYRQKLQLRKALKNYKHFTLKSFDTRLGKVLLLL
jgi:hypothetical protein